MGEKNGYEVQYPRPLPEKHGGLAGEKDKKGSNACGPVLQVREI